MRFNILTEKQSNFLRVFGEEDFLARNFYLTGGTALAEFYLGHRFSEDLDFFSDKEFDVLGLNVFLKKNKKVLGFSTVDFQESNNRNLYFLRFDGEVLKTEFTFFPFPRIEESNREKGLMVDSLLDIAVNKLFTIYQRTQARDFIDLYLIYQEKGFRIGDLATKAKIKFDWHIDPLQLGTQFLKVREAIDYPRMIRDLNKTEWQEFFIEEAKKLKKEIIS
ncbi:MAG: nucleotidyl transferase AbiEii/AbiGii toxin family protein [Patescibacteria group bacterium]